MEDNHEEDAEFNADENAQTDPDLEPDLTQEDCWHVIDTFFNEKGLVRQQLDSFDEFVENTMQEIVDENQRLVIQTNGSGNEADITVYFGGGAANAWDKSFAHCFISSGNIPLRSARFTSVPQHIPRETERLRRCLHMRLVFGI